MARSLFLLLVLVNLGFYVWAAGYLGGHDQGREPERVAQQVDPEKLQVSVLGEQSLAQATCRRLDLMPMVTAEGLKSALEGREGVSATLLPRALTSYWVSIPPQSNKAAAEKKAAELKELGITDFFVVNDPGPSFNAISLGLFHTEDSANERLAQLTRKGVKSARIDTRPRPADQAGLEVRGPADFLAKQLPELLVSFSVAPATDCPAK